MGLQIIIMIISIVVIITVIKIAYTYIGLTGVVRSMCQTLF